MRISDWSSDVCSSDLEVRAFLADRMPPEFATRTDTGLRMSKEDHVRWQRILFEKGWIAPGWPVEHGGTGWTAMQKHIFEEECALAGAPPIIPFGQTGRAPCRERVCQYV